MKQRFIALLFGIMAVFAFMPVSVSATCAYPADPGGAYPAGSYGCGAVVMHSCTLTANMNCSTRHGLIIGAAGITIDGAGFTLDGGGVAGRICEVLTYVEDDCNGGVDERIWCKLHPCRQAVDGGVVSSGIVNARVLPGGPPGPPAGQGGFSPMRVRNLNITGWCDGIWVSGDCDTNGDGTMVERRLTEIVIEGNCIHDNGNDDCGTYTGATCGDGGNWGTSCDFLTGTDCPPNGSRNFNDAIFTAQIGLDLANSGSALYPECVKDGLEFPDLVCPGAVDANGNCLVSCVVQNPDRNFIWHNKIYSQKGCACVSCAGGNGINLQGGLEIDEVLWSGGNEIEKNVIKNCSASGIHYTHATTQNRIHGNYLLGNGLGGIANGCVWCSGSYIYDNVAKGNYGIGIGVAAMAKIKNNIVTDTQPVTDKNAEFAELGYGPLLGDGIMTYEVCDPLAVAAGICTANEGSELLGNTTVGNANLDIFDSSGASAFAYGDENMCQNTSGNYADANPAAPTSNCQFAGGARLNCRGDINHDCRVNIGDFNILSANWYSNDCCPCAE